jgi:integrase
MAKVVARKETGRLLIDFTYRGVRCREQTALLDNPANRKRVQAVVDRLTKAQQDGTFVYGEFFPGSSLLDRFSKPTANVAAPLDVKAAEPSTTPAFATFADQWITDHSIEWRRSHIRSVVSTVQGRIIPHFRDTVVGSITKTDILAFRAALAKEPGRGNKASLSAKRINEIMGTLSQILADAADRFEFTSPMTNVKRLRVKKVDVEPFSLNQVQTMIATVRPDYRNYFVVRFFTGMRTGEVHGLKWKYVDFERRQILVRETFVLGEDEYTKTDGSQRDIQMSHPVWEALMAQHQVTGGVSDYVFCNLLGEPLDNTNFTKRVWYPLLRHLGYEERKPYQMRHTAATLWLASGEAPEWIARQLGHTSTEMLFRVYSRYVPNLTRQDGSAMERLLASRLSQGPLVPMDTEAGNFHSNSDAPTNQRGATALAVPTKVITYTPIHHAGTIQTMPQPKPRGRVAQRSCVRADPTTRAKTSVGCPKRVTQHERTR